MFLIKKILYGAEKFIFLVSSKVILMVLLLGPPLKLF